MYPVVRRGWRRRNTHLSPLWEMWCYCGWFKVWTAKSCFGEWLWPLSADAGNTGICAAFTSSCVTQNSFTTITRSIFASLSATRHHVLPYHFWHGGFFSDMFLSWFFLVLEVNYFLGDLFLTVSSCTKSDDSMYHKTWCKLFIWGLAYQHNKNNNTFALLTQVETEARLCRGLTNPQTHPVKWSRVTPSVNGHKSLLTNNKSVS